MGQAADGKGTTRKKTAKRKTTKRKAVRKKVTTTTLNAEALALEAMRAAGLGQAKEKRKLTEAILAILDEVADIATNKDGLTWRQLLAKAALINACKGSGPVFRELFSRIEGKASETDEAEDRVLAVKAPLRMPRKKRKVKKAAE